MSGLRDEFPELAEALDRVGPGASVKDFSKAVRSRTGRPKGSRNRSDAMTCVGRRGGIEEYMRISGRSPIGLGCFRARPNADENNHSIEG